MWRHQIGCQRPELVKQKVMRHRGGLKDQREGSEETNLQRPSRGPPWSLPLCILVSESWVTSTWWLATGGPLGDCWCCVCRVILLWFGSTDKHHQGFSISRHDVHNVGFQFSHNTGYILLLYLQWTCNIPMRLTSPIIQNQEILNWSYILFCYTKVTDIWIL